MANLRWLWSHARKAGGLLLLATALMALETAANLASVALQQTMIDKVLIGGERDRFWPVLALIAAAYAVYSILFTYGPHVIHLTVARIRQSMGGELMERMYRMPTGTLHKERTATFVYHFTNDLQTAAHLAGSDVPRVAQQLVTAVVIMAVMAAASPKLLAAMLVFAVLYVTLGRKFAPARKKAAADVSRTRAALLVHLEEGVSSTREVIAFHRESWEAEGYRARFGEYFRSVIREGKLTNMQMLLSEPLKWGSLLFVLMVGGMLALDGELSVGLFVIAVQFTTRMMDTFNGLYQYAMELSAKTAAVERIRRVLGADSIPEGHRRFEEPIRSVNLRDVGFAYDAGAATVLNGLNATLRAWEKTAFVGASGGGKSTVAGLLALFHEPQRGTIEANGVPLREMARADWMSRVTIVFQEPYLFPDTIRTNLLLGRDDISEARMIEVCRAMMIDEYFASLPDGYDTVIGERGVTLSGGQRQRLALARAVLRDTELLILDEATSSLDLETERLVQANLDRLRQGRMTIVIAHRLSTVRNADQIIVLDGGVAVEAGTHDELLAHGRVYRSLVLKEQEQQVS